MSQQCDTPFGLFQLKRIPDNDKNLQAWNSADLYILNQVNEWFQEGRIDLKNSRILILNDAFGTLSVAMSQFQCDSLSDSFISHDSAKININNNCPDNSANVTFIKSTDALTEKYDLVLFKEFKSQSFLKDQMQKLAPALNTDTLILGGIMAKNLQKNTIELISKIIGPTKASLTWKKARLLFVSTEIETLKNADGIPEKTIANIVSNTVSTYQLDESQELIYNFANVFSKNKLDIGTRFFLQHFPTENLISDYQHQNIIDLGCGNGILALRAAHKYPYATITCVDESYMAIASAKMTLEANLKLDKRKILYQAANALINHEAQSADLILCNPPFHQQYVIGDAIAWQMFKDSKRVLKKGGVLWIVGNRHLGYHLKLKKIFGNHKVIATNNKFVIIKAVKT